MKYKSVNSHTYIYGWIVMKVSTKDNINQKQLFNMFLQKIILFQNFLLFIKLLREDFVFRIRCKLSQINLSHCYVSIYNSRFYILLFFHYWRVSKVNYLTFKCAIIIGFCNKHEFNFLIPDECICRSFIRHDQC